MGTQLCMELRDAIALSPRYEQTTDKTKAFWGLHVTCIAEDSTSVSSAQAVTMTVGPGNGLEFFIENDAYITGLNRTKEQAEVIFASLDHDVDQILNATGSSASKLRSWSAVYAQLC